MHQDKQLRPALFALHTRLYKRFFLACCCLNDESVKGVRAAQNLFSYFANGKAATL